MSPGEKVLGVALILEAAAGLWILEARLERWFLRRSIGQVRRMIGLVLAVHAPALALCVAVSLVGPAWLVATAIAIYGPFVVCFTPSQVTGVRLHRDMARSRGATSSAAKALYWTGAPFGFLGLTWCVLAFLEHYDG